MPCSPSLMARSSARAIPSEPVIATLLGLLLPVACGGLRASAGSGDPAEQPARISGRPVTGPGDELVRGVPGSAATRTARGLADAVADHCERDTAGPRRVLQFPDIAVV